MNMLTTIARKINESNIDKTKTVSINLLKFDKSFKEVFTQEESKVERIAFDMTEHGFDKSQPIIITEDYSILDGNSRFLAAQRAGIKTVPVIIKRFDNKEDALVYEYKLQLNRRNLTDAEIFLAYTKLQELRIKRGDKGRTDEILAEQLKRSPRQINKMKEVSRKASEELLGKITRGEMTVNKAYTLIKEKEKKEAEKKNQSKRCSVNPNKAQPQIDKKSFCLAVLFVLELIEAKTTRSKLVSNQVIKAVVKGKNALTNDEKRIIADMYSKRDC